MPKARIHRRLLASYLLLQAAVLGTAALLFEHGFETSQVVLAALLLALGFAVFIGYAFSRIVTQPLISMTRAATAMTNGDFSSPLPRPSRDEMGELIRSLHELRRQLATRLGELRAERDKLRAVLDGMSEGVALTEKGVIALTNTTFRTLLAASAGIEGRTALESVRLPALADAIDRATRERIPIEVGLTTAGRTLQVSVRPLGEAGSEQCVIVLLDVTDARRLEKVRRDFVANASHELRTPVAAILAAAETLAGGAAEEPQARDSFIAILERHARRLATLASDLLDISRLESGFRPRLAPVPLRSAVAAVLAGLRAQADEKHIAIEDHTAGQPLAVIAERASIEQIFTNLVENAIKYTPEGGKVTVSAEADADRVRIAVTDTGVGIAAEHLPRIWERFYRVDEARSREMGGTGLGLSIVRHLTLAHDGQLEVQSEVGQGTRFVVTLRRA